MEEEQNQDQEEQPEPVEEQPKKKIIPTRLGSLIILLVAVIVGAGAWWYMDSYTPPEVVEEIQERREVKNELLSEYEKGMPSYYKVKDDGVYFLDKLLDGVDPRAFEYIGNYYVKNESNVYYREKLLAWADPETFECFKDFPYYMCKDKNFLFREGMVIISDKNEKNLESLDWYHPYYTNGTYVYEVDGAGYRVLDVDGETFKLLGEHTSYYTKDFSKDKNNVYYREELIKGADPETFEYIDGYYAKDINYVYYRGVAIEGSDPDTFEFLEIDYGKDKNYVYVGSKKIKEADSVTFKKIIYNYSKDKNNVYLNDRVLDVDAVTFEYFGWSDYFKDKNNLYYYNSEVDDLVVIDVDLETLSVVGEYFKDKNFVYNSYEGGKVNNELDTKTLQSTDAECAQRFEQLFEKEHPYNTFYKDKNGVYCLRNKVENVDPETFESVNDSFGSRKIIKDKNGVYDFLNNVDWKNGEQISSSIVVPIENIVDLETFQFLNNDYYKDKYNVYELSTDYDGAVFEAVIYGEFDSETFVILGKRCYQCKSAKGCYDNSNYLKDKDGVYCGLTKIDLIDAETFELINEFYAKDKNNVYHYGEIVEGVNPENCTAESIDGCEAREEVERKELSGGYYIKGGIVYVYGEAIEGADPETFETLKGDYSRDKDHVYKSSGSIHYDVPYKTIVLNSIDSLTVEIMDYCWTSEGTAFSHDFYIKDKNAVYCGEIEMTNADPETFEDLKMTLPGDFGISSSYAKDKNYVYLKEKIIDGADPETFEMVNVLGELAYGTNAFTGYVKDKNNVYFLDRIINGADPSTFGGFRHPDWEPYSHLEYGKDKNHVYYNTEIIKDADPETFEIINEKYRKDKNYVYEYSFDKHGYEKVQGVDPLNCIAENLNGCKAPTE